MGRLKTTFFILILIESLFSYTDIQSRKSGVIQDIKYVGKYSNRLYKFAVRTDKCYWCFFRSNNLPYFNIGDTLIQYWIDYQLKGLGTNKIKFYYSVTD